MLLLLSLWISKAVLKILRLVKRGGTALPGKVALKLDRRFIAKLARRFKKGVIVVSGTNGKTTTVKLIADTLKLSGHKVVTNSSGSNLLQGIAAALVKAAGPFGKIEADYGLFEVDEATMAAAVRELDPKVVAIINLYRDQLDRYGELDHTAELLSNALKFLKNAKVILNADDPLVASLAASLHQGSSASYFGIEDKSYEVGKTEGVSELKSCLFCGETLDYSACYFGHLGKYTCPTGDFNRPTPAVKATKVTLKGMDGQQLALETADNSIDLTSDIPGLYNTYNILASLAVCTEVGITPDKFASALQRFEAAFGRMEKVVYGNHQLYLLLIKNPMGFNQVVRTFVSDGSPKNLLIAINDNFADGTDISWLWDVDFELLTGQCSQLIVTGKRADEMALRLKYAEIASPPFIVEPDVNKALERMMAETPNNSLVYIMPTYTAMLALRSQIVKGSHAKHFWEES